MEELTLNLSGTRQILKEIGNNELVSSSFFTVEFKIIVIFLCDLRLKVAPKPIFYRFMKFFVPKLHKINKSNSIPTKLRLESLDITSDPVPGIKTELII